MAYHDHSDDRAVAKILATLARGGSVALVSDAGPPLVSDPGYRLVRAVQDQGHPVHPLPGPCAAIAALSAAGLPTDRFLFEGFLPAREGARNNRLARLAREPATLVFYEAPHRLTESLAALDLALTTDDLAQIEAAIPLGAAAGDRYNAQQMAILDSER